MHPARAAGKSIQQSVRSETVRSVVAAAVCADFFARQGCSAVRPEKAARVRRTRPEFARLTPRKSSRAGTRFYTDSRISVIRDQQTEWAQKTMKKAKLIIACIFLLVLCVGVACVEYNLVMRSGILFSVFASVTGLFVLLGALIRAPEGYEDENGFHIRARRKQAHRPRQVLATSDSRC
jgi:hypothetical protein